MKAPAVGALVLGMVIIGWLWTADVSSRAQVHEKAVVDDLNHQISAAQDLAARERAARIEAEVKAARSGLAAAIAETNKEIANIVCDSVRGVKDKDANSKITSAKARLDPFLAGCAKGEPMDDCAERKVRDAAR